MRIFAWSDLHLESKVNFELVKQFCQLNKKRTDSTENSMSSGHGTANADECAIGSSTEASTGAEAPAWPPLSGTIAGNIGKLWEVVTGATSPLNEDFADDVLILAGDVHHELEGLKESLKLFCSVFGHVAFVPGNHELWITHKDRDFGVGDVCASSRVSQMFLVFPITVLVQRMRLGVGKRLAYLVDLSGQLAFLASLFMCSEGGSPASDTHDYAAVARVPESNIGHTRRSESDHSSHITNCKTDVGSSSPEGTCGQESACCEGGTVVITFSHFLPRAELAKLYPLSPGALAYVMGSTRIDEQLRQADGSMHVFGHSHVNVDHKIEVRSTGSQALSCIA
ncbi:uncharacterized protein EMH_0067580 [Eimeria mitis]|uniref:Calcineurin-like phosphoesterase domain-containing protein n=1 Tax=Eimeria mitis TaxID=44415 RepID=U6KA48_9EIME|nr:uncharacterized protein EMH_0067580 [Eimeria mitis]CDJ34824.1 hypothetical protein, conserved [Eimeria mitis]